MSRWKPGYAKRIAAMTKGIVPWQKDLLQRMENTDVDADFREITAVLNMPPQHPQYRPGRGAEATFFEVDGEPQ